MTRETRTGGRNATDATVPGRFGISIGRPQLPEPPGFSWQPLSGLARLESGHTPSRARDDYWGGTIPWIGIRDATQNHGRTLIDTLQHVTQAGIDNSSARILPIGTVCLSRTASVGYVVITGRPMATSQDFVNWVCSPSLSSSYLRYLLMAEQDSIRKFAFGSVHQTLYYPDAKALYACLPKRADQDAVATVLGALDEKIVANAALTRTAEKLMEALYLRAVVPDQALRQTFFQVADVKFGEPFRGSNFSSVGVGRPLIRIRDLRTNRCQVWSTEFRVREEIVEPGDLLVGMDAEFRPSAWTGEPALLNQRVCKVSSRIWGTALLREAIRGPLMEIERAKSATTVIHLNKSDLERSEVVVPTEDQAAKLNAIMQPVYDHSISIAKESGSLTKLRDTLLPALMSGRLRVKDAERHVEDAV